MTSRENIQACLMGRPRNGEVIFLPDLTVWYEGQRMAGTLPAAWRDMSLPQVATTLGLPVWLAERPWRTEWNGASVEVQESADRRVFTYHTTAGDLVAAWSRGPDGDWWQTEYPVKSLADLLAAQALARARTYVVSPEPLLRRVGEVGDAGVVALELPMRPFSDVLHTVLGWGDGLLLWAGEGKPIILEILAILEEKLRNLVQAVADLPVPVVLAPDNLDGQYVSPRIFRDQFAASYRQTVAQLSPAGKSLVVHIGGTVRRLLPGLADAGVSALEGIAGPPQADATLTEARAATGPNVTLWGGIPQDLVLPAGDRVAFEAAAVEVIDQAGSDSRVVVGIADRVPVAADLDRLVWLAERCRQVSA